MWTTDQLGLAVWSDDGAEWYFDARGGDAGIGVVAADESDPNAFDASGRYVSLNPAQPDLLPAAAEQFVRGDRWHVNYPQGDGSYALRLAFQPIESVKDLIVVELTISIQTDLLDTHPRIDMDALCQSIDSMVPGDPSGDEVEDAGSAPISVATSDDHHTCVLLGPHDSPFTTNHSTDSLLRLRLFGDFLEKGVIRKARPWIVIDRSGNPPSQARLQSWWTQLCGSPLPLTP